MRDAIRSLIQLLKTHSAQIFELEDWEWRDWCALAPRDPEAPHPMRKPDPWQTSYPNNPYHPYPLDEEIPL